MQFDGSLDEAVIMAGRVKGKMVDFATSPPLEKHLRRIVREVEMDDVGSADPMVVAVERLLFEFRFDDGSSVVDRFIRQPGLSEEERRLALGFCEGVEGFFEVLSDAPAGANSIEVRCCLSDLEHVVLPTEPAGVPALAAGTFLVGGLNPIAETGSWTPSGALRLLGGSGREVVAEAVMKLALQSPHLTHRNPEKHRAAVEQSAEIYERFLEQHGTDLVLVEGKDLANVYADALVFEPSHDPDEDSHARARAIRTMEDSELSDADEVAIHCHPVAGFGFYLDFSRVTRALERGTLEEPQDVEALSGYLNDPGVPNWWLRRLVEERLPTAEGAISQVLRRPGFQWDRDGEALLSSKPGDQEPVLGLAIVPTMCAEDRML